MERCLVLSALKTFDLLSSELYRPISNARVVVFDQSIVGDCDRAGELRKRLKQDIVVFTVASGSCALTMRLIELGASWIFENTLVRGDFELGFQRLMQIAEEFNSQLQRFRHLHGLLAKITAVESDVLRLILEGRPNNKIAEQLQVSVRTIEARRAKIYRKCSVGSIVELVRYVDEFEFLKQIFEVESHQSAEKCCAQVG